MEMWAGTQALEKRPGWCRG